MWSSLPQRKPEPSFRLGFGHALWKCTKGEQLKQRTEVSAEAAAAAVVVGCTVAAGVVLLVFKRAAALEVNYTTRRFNAVAFAEAWYRS